MASIQAYLTRLETRLAPSLGVHDLQERLTEAEVHLRDRAQEFEEIGLPPPEAEARAVAAFGDPEEFAEDVLAQPALCPPVAVTDPPRNLSLHLASSILTLGVLAAIGMDRVALMIAILVAAIVLAVGALFGRPTPLRRLARISLALAVGAFAVMMIAYVPGYAPLVAINRNEIETTGLISPPNTDRFYRFERRERLFLDRRDVLRTADDWGVDSGMQTDRFVAPTAEGRMQSYRLEADAVHAWRLNGPEAHEALLAAARAEGLFFDGYATMGERAKPFAFDALVLGTLFMALACGLQAIAAALRGGFSSVVSSARWTRGSDSSFGSWEKP